MANYRKPYDDDCCAREHDHDKKCDFPETILSCGQGSGLTLPVNNVAVQNASGLGFIGTQSLPVGTVTIDSSCLVRPEVKIEFSSILNFKADLLWGFTFRVVFKLSRICDRGSRVPLSTFTYEKSLNIGLGSMAVPSGIFADFQFSEPFGFVFCDCQECPGCCDYIVEIVDIAAYNIEGASITNVGIAAVASGDPKRDF